ncbi:hypothetical protein DPX16_10644 [Anabarilius grahami]|uniref:Uncharacterized protein n=1 Tax=Anabarilius grahami TaxID=495550 RepID=A0A3N0Z7A3_ANAGA|nr:hypothetical protein DPX16_10644 [Anabarilius grahami]
MTPRISHIDEGSLTARSSFLPGYGTSVMRFKEDRTNTATNSSTMGLFLLLSDPADTNNTILAVDRLWGLRQNDRPLERYVEEFSELSCQVGWPDAPLNACFLMSLDKDTIRYSEPASPSETHVAWSAHFPPVPSTYPFNESAYSCLPVFLQRRKWASNSADLRAKVVDLMLRSVRSALKSASLPAADANATPEPCHKMAAIPEPRRKMATATSEPSVQMYWEPEMVPTPESAPVSSPVPEFMPESPSVPESAPVSVSAHDQNPMLQTLLQIQGCADPPNAIYRILKPLTRHRSTLETF